MITMQTVSNPLYTKIYSHKKATGIHSSISQQFSFASTKWNTQQHPDQYCSVEISHFRHKLLRSKIWGFPRYMSEPSSSQKKWSPVHMWRFFLNLRVYTISLLIIHIFFFCFAFEGLLLFIYWHFLPKRIPCTRETWCVWWQLLCPGTNDDSGRPEASRNSLLPGWWDFIPGVSEGSTRNPRWCLIVSRSEPSDLCGKVYLSPFDLIIFCCWCNKFRFWGTHWGNFPGDFIKTITLIFFSAQSCFISPISKVRNCDRINALL